MSNERKLTFRLNVAKSGMSDEFNLGTISEDMTGEGGGNPGTVTVGFAAEEVIDFGDLSSDLIIVMRNLDDTNFVNYAIGPVGGSAEMGGILRPQGFPGLIELESTSYLWMQADTADCDVIIRAYPV